MRRNYAKHLNKYGRETSKKLQVSTTRLLTLIGAEVVDLTQECQECNTSEGIMEMTKCEQILCPTHFAWHTCSTCELLSATTGPSSKWLKACQLIQQQSKKNFLVFHEWVLDRSGFASYLETQTSVLNGMHLLY